MAIFALDILYHTNHQRPEQCQISRDSTPCAASRNRSAPRREAAIVVFELLPEQKLDPPLAGRLSHRFQRRCSAERRHWLTRPLRIMPGLEFAFERHLCGGARFAIPGLRLARLRKQCRGIGMLANAMDEEPCACILDLATEQVCAAARVRLDLQATLRKFGSAEDGVLPLACILLPCVVKVTPRVPSCSSASAPSSARSRFATSSPAPGANRNDRRKEEAPPHRCFAGALRLVIELLPRRRTKAR